MGGGTSNFEPSVTTIADSHDFLATPPFYFWLCGSVDPILWEMNLTLPPLIFISGYVDYGLVGL